MYRNNFSTARPSLRVADNSPMKRIIELSEGDYTRNVNGFIRSDFAELMDSQDALQMSRTLQKMQEILANEPDNSNKSFDEIVAMVRPRYLQSPAELDRFELYCMDNALETYSKLKKLSDEEKEALAHAKTEEVKRTIMNLSETERASFIKSLDLKSE